MTERRFPPPWSVEELGACFVVKDGAGQKLAYVYSRTSPAGDRRPSFSRRKRRQGLRPITYKRASNASDCNAANTVSTGPLQLGLQRWSDPISVWR
jgi:hypothetical protein